MSTWLRQNGFAGMRYSVWPVTDPGECWFVQNMYCVDSKALSPLRDRLGFNGEVVTGLTAAYYPALVTEFYSSTRSKWIQVVVGITSSDSAIICANEEGAGWSLAVSTANLTAAGISVESEQLHATTYNGQLLVCDNTNQPWLWNGTAGAGLTLLNNAPASVVGNPTVYYGKSFFAKGDSTVVWSEENAPNVGYEASGYNNAWSLSQTASENIVALQGTNEGLYYFRKYSIGLIRGAVTPDFSTTGVHDAVSTGIGCGSAQSVLWIRVRGVGDTIFFTDSLGRPHAIRSGEVIPLWESVSGMFCAGNWSLLNDPFTLGYTGFTITRTTCKTVLSRANNQVHFWYASGSTGGFPLYQFAVAFNMVTLRCEGFVVPGATSTNITAIGPAQFWYTSTAYPGYAVCGTAASTRRIAYATEYSRPYDTIKGVSLEHPTRRVIVGPMGRDTEYTKSFDRISVQANANTGVRASIRPLSVEKPADSVAPSYQTVDLVESVPTGTISVPHKAVVGIDVRSRWLAPDITLKGYYSGVEQEAKELLLFGASVRSTVADTEPEDQ